MKRNVAPAFTLILLSFLEEVLTTSPLSLKSCEVQAVTEELSFWTVVLTRSPFYNSFLSVLSGNDKVTAALLQLG